MFLSLVFMKSLKRKALSNASALPAILYVRDVSFEKYTHQYISHGAIATFAEYMKKQTSMVTKTNSVCHFQTIVTSVVTDLKGQPQYCIFLLCTHSNQSHILYPVSVALLVTVSDNVVKVVSPNCTQPGVFQCVLQFCWHLTPVVFQKKTFQYSFQFDVALLITSITKKNTSSFSYLLLTHLGGTCAQHTNMLMPRFLSQELCGLELVEPPCRAQQPSEGSLSLRLLVYKYKEPRFLFSCRCPAPFHFWYNVSRAL